FALVPLPEVRRIRPLLLLRDDEVWDTSTPGFTTAGAAIARPSVSARARAWLRQIDWLRLTVSLLVIASLVGRAGWQAGSWRVGVYVSAGFILTTIVLHIVGMLLVRAVRPLANVS